jgi:hypothetical protein
VGHKSKSGDSKKQKKKDKKRHKPEDSVEQSRPQSVQPISASKGAEAQAVKDVGDQSSKKKKKKDRASDKR